MSESAINRNLRHMAWERAKGELKSMLHTYWEDDGRYENMDLEINKFIAAVEDDGLHE